MISEFVDELVALGFISSYDNDYRVEFSNGRWSLVFEVDRYYQRSMTITLRCSESNARYSLAGLLTVTKPEVDVEHVPSVIVSDTDKYRSVLQDVIKFLRNHKSWWKLGDVPVETRDKYLDDEKRRLKSAGISSYSANK